MSLTASSPFYRPLDIKAPYFNFLNIFLPSKCFPDSSVGKESAFNAGDHSSTLGSGRSSGEGIDYPTPLFLGFSCGQLMKNLPALWETWIRSLGCEDPLEKGKATHSSIVAWRIPWTV